MERAIVAAAAGRLGPTTTTATTPLGATLVVVMGLESQFFFFNLSECSCSLRFHGAVHEPPKRQGTRGMSRSVEESLLWTWRSVGFRVTLGGSMLLDDTHTHTHSHCSPLLSVSQRACLLFRSYLSDYF